MSRRVNGVAALALCGLLPLSALAAPCVPGDPQLAGHYVLNGEMEVGSELLLLSDGQFQFVLAYGAIDQYGTGCWSLAGQVLTLQAKGRRTVPAQHSPDDRKFRGMVLTVQPDGRLGWPLPGFRGKFEKY